MYEDDEFQRKFKVSFLRNNHNTYVKIEDAMNKGDTVLAHRLVHSIKGNAGQARIAGLAKIASEIEKMLGDGITTIPPEKMSILKNELETAIEELKSLYEEKEAQEPSNALSNIQVLELYEKLKPMLENNDSAASNILKKLKTYRAQKNW